MRIVEIAGRCERGLVRERNEDRLLVVDLDEARPLDVTQPQRASGERGPLLVVCDGMGGRAGGHIASARACEVIRREMQEAVRTDKRAVMARNLRRAVRAANRELVATAAADKGLKGMGTTVSAAALVGNTAVLAQVGDSRAYVLRNQRLTQITRDQSVVSALIQAGKISEEQAQASMQRGRILQALGASNDVEVSLSIAELRAGDRLLLCSDGLHGLVDDETIARSCAIDSLQEAVASLVDIANRAGGSDNVTVVLAEVNGDSLRPPLAGEEELRFTEIDHALEDGADALSTTSIVGRRLAHQAGLRKDSWPPRVPATAQHAAVSSDQLRAQGLAEEILEQRSRMGAWHLLVLGGFALLCLTLLLLWA